MAVLSTLDHRFWLASGAGAAVALLALGIPTALVPNPLFGRMLAAEPFAYAVWVATGLLAGPIVATYVAPARSVRCDADEHPHPGRGTGQAGIGGLAAFLAIGCPICNKVVVGLLGVGGALNLFSPIQPVLGAGSVALLAATFAWRLRARGRVCARCLGGPATAEAG